MQDTGERQMKGLLQIGVAAAAMLIGLGASAAKPDDKGHGAGGVRADHASEQGLEKGKAWADLQLAVAAMNVSAE